MAYRYSRFKKETDLSGPVIAFFEEKYPGCEVFQEVKAGYSKKIDVVIRTQDGLVIPVELKLHANLQLLNQGYNNCKFANFSYVVIPARSSNTYGSKFFPQLCESLGLGLLLIESDMAAYERVAPLEMIPYKKLVLLENQKTFVQAGEASGKCWTEFSETVMNIENHIEANGPDFLSNILPKIKHHYSNLSSAKQCLRKYVERKVIKTLYINDDNKVDLIKNKKDGQ